MDRELVLGGNFAFLGLEHPRPDCYIGCPQPRKHKGRAARSSPTAPRSQRQPPTRDAPPRRVPAPEMAPYANDSDDETTLLVEEAGVVPVYGRAARGKRRKPRACQWAALGAIAALAGFGVVTTRATASTTQNYAQAPFQWRATNDYVETLGSIGDDYAWTNKDVQVIDTWRPFQLYLDGTSSTVVWTLTQADGKVITKYGNGVSHIIQSVGDVRVKGIALDDQGVIEGSSEGTLLVRYVRREIRDLTAEDRNRYLDALHVMWEVEGNDGRQQFTDKYISSNELLALHGTNSALRDNDHFHNGAGFLAQHLRLDTMVLESVQSIDPRVSTPYWDWTVEMAQVDAGELESPFESPLWTAEWFGSLNYALDPVVVGPHYGLSATEFFDRGFETWAIQDGRWAFSKVRKFKDSDPDRDMYPRNSYGFLRSPWNNNPSPYVTRVNFAYVKDAVDAGLSPVKSWPTCSDLYAFMRPATTAVAFMTHLEDMTVHANIHQALGGTILDVASTETLLDAFESVEIEGYTSCYQTVSERHMWRMYLSDFPDSCDDSHSEGVLNCQLTCKDLPDDDVQLEKIGAWAVDHYACWNVMGDVDALSYADQATPAALKRVGRAICSTTFIKGEHLEASGTTDPSFFIVHPSLGRYYQMKKIMALQEPGTFVDDWAEADYGEGSCLPATGECLVASDRDQPSSECCAGHYRYSTFFKDKMRTPAAGATLTNGGVMDAADPSNAGPDNLVFQHLRFDHCEDDFAALLDPTAQNAAPLTGYLYDDFQSGPSGPWGTNAGDGHKQNWDRIAKPTGATAPYGSNAPYPSGEADGHKAAWPRDAKAHFPGAEPGSRNSAPPVAVDEEEAYAHKASLVQTGMLS